MRLVIVARVASALRYAESEGPTKVDYGEDDPNVLPRENDYDGTGDYAWTNPLSKTDDGLADETVLTMIRSPPKEEVTVLTMEDGSTVAVDTTAFDADGKAIVVPPVPYGVDPYFMPATIVTNMPF